MAERITVETIVETSPDKVWHCWTTPDCIMQWNAASDDWHTPRASMDLKEGGKFLSRMEAKDGSAGFDFEGTFTKVVPNEHLAYAMPDGRAVEVTFADLMGRTLVSETFDAETENPVEMQKQGWQAILDNFKKHVEGHRS